MFYIDAQIPPLSLQLFVVDACEGRMGDLSFVPGLQRDEVLPLLTFCLSHSSLFKAEQKFLS